MSRPAVLTLGFGLGVLIGVSPLIGIAAVWFAEKMQAREAAW